MLILTGIYYGLHAQNAEHRPTNDRIRRCWTEMEQELRPCVGMYD